MSFRLSGITPVPDTHGMCSSAPHQIHGTWMTPLPENRTARARNVNHLPSSERTPRLDLHTSGRVSTAQAHRISRCCLSAPGSPTPRRSFYFFSARSPVKLAGLDPLPRHRPLPLHSIVTVTFTFLGCVACIFARSERGAHFSCDPPRNVKVAAFCSQDQVGFFDAARERNILLSSPES